MLGHRDRLPWWRLALPLPVVAWVNLFGIAVANAASSTTNAGAMLLLLFLALSRVLTIVLWWRAMFPRTVMLITALGCIFLPVTPTAALVSLVGFIDRAGPLDSQKRMEVGAAVALTGLAGVTAAMRDALAPNIASSFTMLMVSSMQGLRYDSSAHVPVPFWVSLVSVVVPLGIAVLIGVVRRATRLAKGAEARNVELGTELSRKAEREALARDVHDMIGNRISLISLKAGSLEVRRDVEPEVSEAASDIRELAGGAMGDLRSLINQLERDPGPQPLAELQRIVRETSRRNDVIQFGFDPTALASPELARTAVRIVQEALANARKHAPGSPLRLEVEGAPGHGLHIRCSNWMPPPTAASGTAPMQAPSGFSGGRGVANIAERTRLLGGTCFIGQVGNEFRVLVTLPWAPVV